MNTKLVQAGFGAHNQYEIKEEQGGLIAYRRCGTETWHTRRPNSRGYIKFLNWCALHVDSGLIVSRGEGGFNRQREGAL